MQIHGRPCKAIATMESKWSKSQLATRALEKNKINKLKGLDSIAGRLDRGCACKEGCISFHCMIEVAANWNAKAASWIIPAWILHVQAARAQDQASMCRKLEP